VSVRVPTTATTALGEYLRAPRLDATGGVTIGGQSFGASTTTGTLTGSPVGFTLASTHGRFPVELPPASATLLTIASA